MFTTRIRSKHQHSTPLIVCLMAALMAGSGCGLIYKQNIQQGNALEQEDLDELYIGMTKRQGVFVLGSPSIQDPFQQQRWDYVQTFSRRGGDPVQRTVTLRFENELLTEIIGANQSTDENSLSAPDDTTVAASSSAKPDSKEADPHAASVEAAKEEALEPEIRGLGERSAEDRDLEKDINATNQRPADDVTSPDIDG